MVFFSLLPYTTIFDAIACRTQNALFRRVRFSSPAQTSTCLTEKHILYPPPHGKTHSVSTASRKSAFCTHHDRRMHFSVRTRSQNALFRRVRLSSPAQTSACLTERRILYPPPHGKAHSGPTQPQDQGLRARRLPAEIGLELGGRLRQYAHEELARRAKTDRP